MEFEIHLSIKNFSFNFPSKSIDFLQYDPVQQCSIIGKLALYLTVSFPSSLCHLVGNLNNYIYIVKHFVCVSPAIVCHCDQRRCDLRSKSERSNSICSNEINDPEFILTVHYLFQRIIVSLNSIHPQLYQYHLQRSGYYFACFCCVKILKLKIRKLKTYAMNSS